MNQKQIIEVSFGTMLKVVLLGGLLWALWELKNLVAVLLLAIVITSAIEPATHWFQKHRIPRVAGVLCTYLAALLVFILIFYLVLPPLFSDIFNFLSQLPHFIDEALGPHSYLFVLFPNLPAALKGSMQSIGLSVISEFQNYFGLITQSSFAAGSALFGGVFSFLLLVVLSFYLSVQEHGIENFLRIVTPLEYEAYILNLWGRAQRKLGRWLQGQILLGVLVGVMVFLMLSILNVKHAGLLAVLTAVFELIPVFGPIMAAIPAVAIASLQGPVLGIKVLITYIVVQQVENHLIYPLVVRKTVGVPPLLVVLALLVGGQLGGLLGIILSVPMAVVLVEFLNDVVEHKYPKTNE